jgi:hypothetical protein
MRKTKKKQEWELRSKEKKEMLDISARIFYAFDGIGDRGSKTGKAETAIKETIHQIVEKEYDELLGQIESDDSEDYVYDFFEPVCYVAFAIGYIFGQMFDLPHPDLLKDVETFKNKAKGKRCFAYLPREKAA